MKQSRSSSSRRARANRKRPIVTIISLVCIAAAVVCLVVIGSQLIEDNKSIENERKTAELYVRGTASPDGTPTPTDMPQAGFTPLSVVNAPADTNNGVQTISAITEKKDNIDATKLVDGQPQLQDSFAKLYSINPDTVGWLTAGDGIDQVIVQRDATYYLDHDFYGGSSSAGVAFMDDRCSIWPRSKHIAIHGHNMKNGTVFGTLARFRTLDYLKQYPIITFNTIYADAQYVPIAAFDASMTNTVSGYFRVINWDFATGEEFMDFVGNIKNRSLFDIPVEVTADDSLLTLITCSYFQEDGRFLLVCRRVRDGESIEDLTAAVQNATAK